MKKFSQLVQETQKPKRTQYRHNLVTTIVGSRVRLRAVPVQTAVALALHGLAQFENKAVQREIDTIRQVFAQDHVKEETE